MGRTIQYLFSFTLLLPLLLIGNLSLSQAATSANEFLDMDITSLMQVQITSVSRKTQSMADAATAIFVITQKDLHDTGVTAIPEALRMAPGLQVARISSNKWAVTTRGFNGSFASKLPVQIDGRSVYSPTFSGVYWDAQYDEASRHEVYLDQHHQTFDLDFLHLFQAGNNHDLIWGWGYRTINDDFDNSWWFNIDPDKRTTHLYSVFIQDEITLLPDSLWLTLEILS